MVTHCNLGYVVVFNKVANVVGPIKSLNINMILVGFENIIHHFMSTCVDKIILKSHIIKY